MMTPESFLDAIAEGTEPTAADKATIDAQIREQRIKVSCYNSQNSTPDVQRLVDEARAEHIPVDDGDRDAHARDATFQAWQTRELRRCWPRSERRRSPMSGSASNALSFRSARVDLGGPHDLARRRPRHPRARVRRGARPQRRREVDAAQRDPRARSAWPRASSRCSGRPPGESNHEIGYLPQRRSFDPSVRIRGIDIVRLGLDGDRYGIPLPGARSRRDRARVDEVIELVGADDFARPARSGSAPAASSSGC